MRGNEERFREPREGDNWDHITFTYSFEGVRLIPGSFETDGFVTEDEIEELDIWTIRVSGKLWNCGAEPDADILAAIRFDGKRYIEEPIKGALAAHLEHFVDRRGVRSMLREYALEHGEKHYRRAA